MAIPLKEFQIHLLGFRMRVSGPAPDIDLLMDSLYSNCQEPPEVKPDVFYRVEAEGGIYKVSRLASPGSGKTSDPCEVFCTQDNNELFWRLENALCEGAMEQARGMLLIHGAAVERDGRATIIMGKSYSGKSTLAIHLIRNGFRLLSDEVILVDLETGLLKPFPRNLFVREGALRDKNVQGGGATDRGEFVLDGLQLGRGQYQDPGGQKKWMLDPLTVATSGFAEEAQVERIVCLQRHRKRHPMLEPSSQRESVEMMVSNAVNLDKLAGDGWDVRGLDTIVHMVRSAENLKLQAPHAGEAWKLLHKHLNIQGQP